jgi:hypothetical protein
VSAPRTSGTITLETPLERRLESRYESRSASRWATRSLSTAAAAATRWCAYRGGSTDYPRLDARWRWSWIPATLTSSMRKPNGGSRADLICR